MFGIWFIPWGHRNLLQRVKALGDYLVVAVSTDEFNCKAIKVMKKDKIVSDESIEYLESHGKIKRCE